MKRPFPCSLGACIGALVLIGLTPAHAQSIASRPVALKVTAADVEAAWVDIRTRLARALGEG